MKQGYAEDRRTMEANVRVARFLSGISCSTLIGACVVVTEESVTTALTKVPYFTRNLDNNVVDSGNSPLGSVVLTVSKRTGLTLCGKMFYIFYERI